MNVLFPCIVYNEPIGSPKFFRKITYIDTLSDLATQVPLTQIDIPPAVYKYGHIFSYATL